MIERKLFGNLKSYLNIVEKIFKVRENTLNVETSI
jgi:hypothetical protein